MNFTQTQSTVQMNKSNLNLKTKMEKSKISVGNSSICVNNGVHFSQHHIEIGQGLMYDVLSWFRFQRRQQQQNTLLMNVFLRSFTSKDLTAEVGCLTFRSWQSSTFYTLEHTSKAHYMNMLRTSHIVIMLK